MYLFNFFYFCPIPIKNYNNSFSINLPWPSNPMHVFIKIRGLRVNVMMTLLMGINQKTNIILKKKLKVA